MNVNIEELRRAIRLKHTPKRNSSKPIVSQEDIRALSDYLNDPFASGLWRLNSNWVNDGGISEFIWKQITNEIGGKDILTITSGKREKRIKITEEWKSEVKQETENNLTFLLYLFTYLVEKESDEEELITEFNANHELTQLILDLIEPDTIKEIYREAFEHFKDNIWYSGIRPGVRAKELTSFKCGSVIAMKGPRSSGSLSMISWEGAPLKHLHKFLELLGKSDNPSLMPVFSPEEEVFAPYFDLLEIAFPYLVKQDHIKPLFQKSINHYNDDNYSDCVSAIGMIGEDILTQIYETLFRTQLHKGLTLGQLADEITVKIDKQFDGDELAAPDLTGLYSKIKESLEAEEGKDRLALEQTRNLLTLVIENNKFINNKIDNIGKPKQKISIFPERVRRAVNELIRLRNAASHKSRIPIGPYEATRSVYVLIVFLMWWDKEKLSIDWSRTPEEIIKGLVSRNS